MQHLNTLRTVSQIVNGSTGKVVHEITSTGAVYYGDNTEPGDINETAQFDIAAGLVWRWSGDQAFLRQNYAFIKAGQHYLVSLEPGGKAAWPAGAGIVENTSLGNEAVDVAAETVQALGVCTRWRSRWETMPPRPGRRSSRGPCSPPSTSGGSPARTCTRTRCARHRGRLRARRRAAPAAVVDQRGPDGAGHRARRQRRRRAGHDAGPTFTGPCGLYVDGVGGPSGTGGQTCYLVNTGAMAGAEANYGRTAQAIAYMDKVASQLTVEMPGSLPELAASAQYNPFEAFTSRANVMQAWSSYGLLWTMVNDLLGVTPDVPSTRCGGARGARVLAVAERSDLRVGSGSLAVTASHQAAATGPWCPAPGAVADDRRRTAQRGKPVRSRSTARGALQAGHRHARARGGGDRARPCGQQVLTVRTAG